MATKYAVVSNSWSNTATWSDTDGGAGGATVPADNDVVVISSGVSVLMDVDQSSEVTFPNGMNGVTIRGDDVTPGMLYFKNGTNGYLKIKASQKIQGTNNTVYGRILANSDGVWENSGELAVANSATILFMTSAYVDAKYLGIKLYCHQPTNKYIEVYKHLNTCTPLLNATHDFETPTAHGFTNGTTVKFKVSAGGSLPSPLIAGYIYTIWVVNSTTFRLRYNTAAPIIPITDSGSGTFEVYDGITAAQGSTINVFTDVSSDIDWSTDSDRNVVCLSSSFGDDLQYLEIAGKTSETITLSASPNSTQHAGSLIILCYRNVRIMNNSSVTGVTLITNQNSEDNVYQCELSSFTGAAWGIRGSNFEFSGISYRMYSATNGAVDSVVSGICIGSHGAGYSGTRITMTGMIVNATNGFWLCTDCTFSGTNSGCLRLFTECTSCNIYNTTVIGMGSTTSHGVYQTSNYGKIINSNFNYCYSLMHTSSGHEIISGSIVGILYVLRYAVNIVFNSDVSITGSIALFSYSSAQCCSEISNCMYLASSSSVEFCNITPSLIETGIYKSQVKFRNSILELSSPVSYLFKSNNHNNGSLSINDGKVTRQLRGWNSGGTISTETYDVGTHGVPPADLDIVYKFLYEDVYSNGIDIPLMGRMNVPTRIKVYMKKSVNEMVVTPYIKLCDANYGFEQTGEQIAIATMVDNTDWQTLIVEYTPDYDMPLILRIAGANSTGITYWNWEQCSSSSWGNMLLGG